MHSAHIYMHYAERPFMQPDDALAKEVCFGGVFGGLGSSKITPFYGGLKYEYVSEF